MIYRLVTKILITQSRLESAFSYIRDQTFAMRQLYVIIRFVIAMVWLINGLVCKMMNVVPRHQEIVSEILSTGIPRTITFLIGIAEVIMAIWILSGKYFKINIYTQISVIAAMNILEYIFVPDLLMFGKLNIVFAGVLIVTIYVNAFIINPDSAADAKLS